MRWKGKYRFFDLDIKIRNDKSVVTFQTGENVLFVLHLLYCSEPNEGDPSPYQGNEDNKNNRWWDVSVSVICTPLDWVTSMSR